MMETKIENQKQYEARIEYFKKKYVADFKKAISPKDCDKNYARTDFQNNQLNRTRNKIINTSLFSEASHYRNQEQWLKGTKTFEAVKLFCEERKLIKEFQLILEALAEYDAISNNYNEIIMLENKLPVNENKPEEIIAPSIFLNDKVISRIDFIRLINALWEMKAFKNKDELLPTKQIIMKEFGNLVGIDLSNYETQLSKAVNTTDIETNFKIFDTLREKMEEYYNKILVKKKSI